MPFPSPFRRFRWWWKGLAVFGALVAVAWFGGNAYIGYRVEKQLQAFLAEHHLQEAVQWERVRANWLGIVKLDNLRVTGWGAGVQVAQVRVSDVKDTAEQLRAHVVAKGLSMQDGTSILQATSGYSRLQDLLPMDVDFALDADYRENTWASEVKVWQPGLADLRAAVQLRQFANARDFLRATGFWGRWQEPQTWQSGALWLALGQIQLQGMHIRLKDDGAVQRWNLQALLEPSTQTSADGMLGPQDCGMVPQLLWLLQPEDACEALQQFAQGEQDTLDLKAEPHAPVAWVVLYQASLNQPRQLAQWLNARLQP